VPPSRHLSRKPLPTLGELQVFRARRAVLATKHSLQPDKLAGGVAQATTHVQRSFTE
jgi:hypothetical protein